MAIGPPDIYNTDAIHSFSPHTQAYENNDLSSSIFVDPSSRNSSGGKKPRAETPISGDFTSVRRDSLGGGNSFQTHEWDGDHGGVQNWIKNGPDYIPKRIMAPEMSTPFNVDPHQHEPEVQKHSDENDNLKKASQQQNSETYTPIVSQANPLEEDENRAGRENVSKHDHGERRKVRRVKSRLTVAF